MREGFPDQTQGYILAVLQWTEAAKPKATVICSDSCAALQAINNEISEAKANAVIITRYDEYECGYES